MGKKNDEKPADATPPVTEITEEAAAEHADATPRSIAAQLRANKEGEIPAVLHPKGRSSSARSAYVAEAYRALAWAGCTDIDAIARRASELASAMEAAAPAEASWEQQAIAAACLSRLATLDGPADIQAAAAWQFAR